MAKKQNDVETLLEEEIKVAEKTLEQDSILCEYCGQLLIGGQECTCKEAKDAREKNDKLTRAIEVSLPRLISEEACEQLNIPHITDAALTEFLEECITSVSNGICEKLTIKVSDQTSFKIVDKPETISITRLETDKFKLEMM